VDIIRMRIAGAGHVALAALRRLGPDYYPHLFERIINKFNES
jgi:hypothetical protein